ncbi:hypothetical protein DPMN_085870 [Dreissena polymorpha]|uniref:Uncharacterized protein n=1 Tax=Dreissena polymorpha TaxID=45954 RepID=A0A9D4BJT2_DREPO|nr:hypothetical protein DPMN_085870 [Dreissena polymorpha]
MTEKNQLFGPFMARLSGCVFKIDQGNYSLLMRAKREELIKQGVPYPSHKDVKKHLTSDEIRLHCKQSTRAGVAKSNVRVAGVVHLLVWATDFFQLSCPWTTSFLKVGSRYTKKYFVLKP